MYKVQPKTSESKVREKAKSLSNQLLRRRKGLLMNSSFPTFLEKLSGADNNCHSLPRHQRNHAMSARTIKLIFKLFFCMLVIQLVCKKRVNFNYILREINDWRLEIENDSQPK